MHFYFDIDGTLFNLYGVENWEPQLRAESCAPYTAAKPMHSFAALARRINTLQRQGHTFTIVSWTSKSATPEYHRRIAWAKYKSLRQHLPSVHWDEIVIAHYGENKSKFGDKGILFDDSAAVRQEWTERGRGAAFGPEMITDVLRAFA